MAAELKLVPTSCFNGFVSGLNRLPRPTLALGIVGLFSYAMADPVGFSTRMQGLDTVPDQLWWLLGAIVSFYFGVRELHYKRAGKKQPSVQTQPMGYVTQPKSTNSAALSEWQRLNR